MKKLLLLFTLFCQTALGCESYDECMAKATRSLKSDVDCSSGHCWAWLELDNREIYYRKAIACKLDEISQKLEKKPGHWDYNSDRGRAVFMESK